MITSADERYALKELFNRSAGNSFVEVGGYVLSGSAVSHVL